MNLAVVVGCSQYADPIPSLRYGAADATQFTQTLHSTCGLGPDEVIVLSDESTSAAEKPNFTNLLRLLGRGRERAAQLTIDILFFFFSGHGYHSVRDGNDYLLLADTVVDELERTSVSLQTVVARLTEWHPKHLVLFIDACREAAADHKGIGTEATAPAVDVNSLLPAGNITFSSCSQGQRSYEHADLGSGLFTAALCEGLSEVGRCRTLHELNSYLGQRVPQLCRTLGKPLQQPAARLEPAEVLDLEIVSGTLRKSWRNEVKVGDERRPARVPRSTHGRRHRLLGIDLGTCKSFIAGYVGPTEIELVPTLAGSPIMPSTVNFDRELNYVVGSLAVEADFVRPEGSVFYPKRWLGTAHQFQVYDRSLTPEFVCSLILRSLRANAEEYLGMPIGPVVASYPASYSIAQANALRKAYELADLQVARYLAEPALAALVPRPANLGDDDNTVLVVDLGGGTLDVSVVESGDGVEEIKATAGDGRLGGLDYDAAIADYIRDQVIAARELDTALPPYLEAQIRREADRAKLVLSSHGSHLVVVPEVEIAAGRYRNLSVFLDEGIIGQVIGALNSRVLRTVQTACDAARIYYDRNRGVRVTGPPVRFDYVLLAGQGTKVPSLRAAIAGYARAPVIDDYQDDAVIRGLAIQAAVMTGQHREQLLLDAMQTGIGVIVQSMPEGRDPRLSTNDRHNETVLTLVEKGTSYPTKRSEVLQIEGTADTVQLRVVELPVAWSTTEQLPLGVVEFAVPASRQVEVIVDVDAKPVIMLTLKDDHGERRILLNRPATGDAESIMDQRLTGSLEEAGG